MFVPNNVLYKELIDEIKRKSQRRIRKCPVCGGMVVFVYDESRPDLRFSVIDDVMQDSNIHDFWECVKCGRLWGIGTSVPIFELR